MHLNPKTQFLNKGGNEMFLYICLIFLAVGLVLSPFFSDTAIEKLIERIGSVK